MVISISQWLRLLLFYYKILKLVCILRIRLLASAFILIGTAVSSTFEMKTRAYFSNNRLIFSHSVNEFAYRFACKRKSKVVPLSN
jgi:hypothetical protein